MEAEEKKQERIHEADKAIEEKRAELTKEYEDKMSGYIGKKHEYESRLLFLRSEGRIEDEEEIYNRWNYRSFL